MANNYTSFSFALRLQNMKEAAWAQKELTKLRNTVDGEGCSGTDYDWTVNEISDERPEATIWFRDNGEGGNLNQIADFVQKYLKRFFPKGYFTMSWAETCSKQRVNEFGGGYCVVTVEKISWFDEDTFRKEHAKGLTGRNAQ